MGKAIHTDGAPQAIGPYSQGVRAGDLIFVSGQLPADPQTGELAQGAAEATARSIQNIEAILAAEGAGLANVVKTTVFLRDMGDFAAVNAEYAKHFHEPFPARACVAVKTLPKDAILEIEAVAAL